jgi:branched-chain amino acid transport system ATP-binding protein
VRALDGLDLIVRAGERVAIIGANGSGKSTLVNVCSGVIRPVDGEIRLDGRAVTDHTPEAFAQAGVGRTFQSLRLMENQTVFDNIALGMHRRMRKLAGLPFARHRRVRTEAAEAAAEVGLDVALWRAVSTLSYGQRKRVELARLLIGQARLLLLDEPTAGVSRVDTPALGRTLRSLADPARALVIVEHDLDLVAAAAERVVCVDAGRVIADGDFDRVLGDAAVRAAVLATGAR